VSLAMMRLISAAALLLSSAASTQLPVPAQQQ
jgi:hypothetical protein